MSSTSARLSHLGLPLENICLRKHFKENEKETIKEVDIESKKVGRNMICGVKGAVYNTARRRTGRRGAGRAQGVCTHTSLCVYSRVHSQVCYVHTRVCNHLCAVCTATCAVGTPCASWLCLPWLGEPGGTGGSGRQRGLGQSVGEG